MSLERHKIYIGRTSFLTAEGLKSLLGQDVRNEIIDGSESDKNIKDEIQLYTPDLWIADASDHDYKDLFSGLLNHLPANSRILILTDNLSREEFKKFTGWGIENILLKTATRQELLSAVESALFRRKFYSSQILDMILEPIDKKQQKESEKQLTASEKEIVRLIAVGLTTKEIAIRKNISFHTVNTHRRNIFRKLKVGNASELIMKSIKSGWVDDIEYYI